MRRSTRTLCVALIALVLASKSARGQVTLTNVTLFRGDANGNNLNGAGETVVHGAWSTQLNQQTLPGSYGAPLFIAQTASPSAADFLSPTASLSVSLPLGDHTFYFWGNGDDTIGGSATFGLNIFLDSAGPVRPTLSAYAPVGGGASVVADPVTSATAGYSFRFAPGAGIVTVIIGNVVVSLSSFQVSGAGGSAPASGTVDIVNSTSTAPFSPPPNPMASPTPTGNSR